MKGVVFSPNTFSGTTIANVTTTGTGTLFYGSGGTQISGDLYSRGPRYWYKIDRRECSICHEVYETRQRMLSPRPPKREERVAHRFIYDYCG